jgi:hypothetical protein
VPGPAEKDGPYWLVPLLAVVLLCALLEVPAFEPEEDEPENFDFNELKNPPDEDEGVVAAGAVAVVVGEEVVAGAAAVVVALAAVLAA